MTKSVLHLGTYLQGGAGLILKDLAIHQQDNGLKVRVIVSKTCYPGYENYPEYLEDLKSKEIEVVLVDSLFKRSDGLNAQVVDFLKRQYGEDPPEIIHAHASIPAKIGKEFNKQMGDVSIPVIQTMQGWGRNKTPEQEARDKEIMNQLDAIVAVSEASKNILLEKGVRESLIQVIHNGVGERGVRLPPNQNVLRRIEAFRMRYDVILGCVGSVCKRKNQVVLLNAVQVLSEKGTSIGLVLIGENDTRNSLNSEILESEMRERVLLTGYTANARDLTKYFDLFCLPSLSEGLPLSILECFCDRVPVIASNICSVKEVIQHGKTGHLFDPTNVEEIVDSIENYLAMSSREKNNLIDNAEKEYEQRFRLSLMLERYKELYKKVSPE